MDQSHLPMYPESNPEASWGSAAVVSLAGMMMGAGAGYWYVAKNPGERMFGPIAELALGGALGGAAGAAVGVGAGTGNRVAAGTVGAVAGAITPVVLLLAALNIGR